MFFSLLGDPGRAGSNYILVYSPVIKAEGCNRKQTFPSLFLSFHNYLAVRGHCFSFISQGHPPPPPPAEVSNTSTPCSRMTIQGGALQHPCSVLHGYTSLISPCSSPPYPHGAFPAKGLPHPGGWHPCGSPSTRLCCLVPCCPSYSLKQVPDTNDQTY